MSGYVGAAEVKSAATKEGRIIVSFTGEIADGDTDAFVAAVRVANAAGKLVTSVRLNSTGGSLIEGVRLAEAIKFGKITTNVGSGATCASACFLIFAAGERKFANYSARMGVHGASDKSGQETVQSGAATVSMARVAKELGVPPSIIGRMVSLLRLIWCGYRRRTSCRWERRWWGIQLRLRLGIRLIPATRPCPTLFLRFLPKPKHQFRRLGVR